MSHRHFPVHRVSEDASRSLSSPSFLSAQSRLIPRSSRVQEDARLQDDSRLQQDVPTAALMRDEDSDGRDRQTRLSQWKGHRLSKAAALYSSLLLPVLLVVFFVLLLALAHRVRPFLPFSVVSPSEFILSPHLLSSLPSSSAERLDSVDPVRFLVPSALDPSQLVHPDVGLLLSASHEDSPLIPDIVHFVIGCLHTSSAPQSAAASRPVFLLQHWLAIKSVRDIVKPQSIYCHVANEPASSPHWQLARVLCSRVLPARNVTHVFGRPVHHAQHKSDILRLEALLQYGGVALDLDVIAVSSWKETATYELDFKLDFLAGLTQSASVNWADRFDASFIAARKESLLLREWYYSYRMFDEREERLPASALRPEGAGVVFEDHLLSFSSSLLWTLSIVRPHLLTQLKAHVIGVPYALEAAGVQTLYGESAQQLPAGKWTVHLWQSEHERRMEVRDEAGQVLSVEGVLDESLQGLSEAYHVQDVQAVCSLNSLYGRALKLALLAGTGHGYKC